MVKCFINLALPCLRLLRQLYLLYLYLSPWFYLSDSVPNKTESHPHTTHTYKNTHLCTPFLVSCILLYYNFWVLFIPLTHLPKNYKEKKNKDFVKNENASVMSFYHGNIGFVFLILTKRDRVN